MVDRLGTKKVLTLGVVLFTVGQLGFALAPSYGTALAARALLGCGDAMTFISVLRLGSRWFPARRGPLIGQVAALFGMAGNLVSTLVIARMLHGMGWTATFAGSAGAGVVVLILLLLFLKDHPEGHAPPPDAARGIRLRTQADRPVVARARHAPRHVGALHHPVPRHGVPAAVGDAVPRRGPAAVPGDRRLTADPCRALQHDGGPGVRAGHRPPPRGTTAARPRHRRRDRDTVGRDPARTPATTPRCGC